MTTRLSPWKLLDRKLLLSAEPWLQVYQERVELPAGQVIDDFYRVVLPDFATIVAVTPENQIVMVRGYKHGLGRVTLSPPAGLLDPGEAPLAAAQRELLEETGYTSNDWKPLGSFVVDGNRQCGTMHLFVARGACRTQSPREDAHEVLEIELVTRDQLVTALRSGEPGNLAGASAVAMALALEI